MTQISRKRATGARPRKTRRPAPVRRTPRRTAPTGYHHGDLREALLEAARELVEHHGASAFTLRECARRAGVSHGAPAHHFGDKTGLLTELAARTFGERLEQASRYMEAAGSDPAKRLKAQGLAHIDYLIAHPKLGDLCARDGFTDRDSPVFQDAMSRMMEALIASMSAATGEALKPDKEENPTTLLALVVVIGFSSVVNERIVLRDIPESRRAAEAHRLADEMLDLLTLVFSARRNSASN